MEDIVKFIYGAAISRANDSPESKIKFYKAEIFEMNQFIEMYEENRSKAQSLDEVIECQDQINFCISEIVKYQKIIEDIKNGNDITIVPYFSDITNMKL